MYVCDRSESRNRIILFVLNLPNIKGLIKRVKLNLIDSPGVPASANAHELFRGFSFIASCLLDDNMNSSPVHNSISNSVIVGGGASIVSDNKPKPDIFRSVRNKLQFL